MSQQQGNGSLKNSALQGGPSKRIELTRGAPIATNDSTTYKAH